MDFRETQRNTSYSNVTVETVTERLVENGHQNRKDRKLITERLDYRLSNISFNRAVPVSYCCDLKAKNK